MRRFNANRVLVRHLAELLYCRRALLRHSFVRSSLIGNTLIGLLARFDLLLPHGGIKSTKCQQLRMTGKS